MMNFEGIQSCCMMSRDSIGKGAFYVKRHNIKALYVNLKAIIP